MDKQQRFAQQVNRIKPSIGRTRFTCSIQEKREICRVSLRDKNGAIATSDVPFSVIGQVGDIEALAMSVARQICGDYRREHPDVQGVQLAGKGGGYHV